jgi:hypothetical protein
MVERTALFDRMIIYQSRVIFRGSNIEEQTANAVWFMYRMRTQIGTVEIIAHSFLQLEAFYRNFV